MSLEVGDYIILTSASQEIPEGAILKLTTYAEASRIGNNQKDPHWVYGHLISVPEPEPDDFFHKIVHVDRSCVCKIRVRHSFDGTMVVAP